MKERVDLQVQGPLDFAIVDEVDSILIDEARTPLIISGAAHDDAPKYRAADEVARKVIEMNKPWDAVEKQVDAAKRRDQVRRGRRGQGQGPRTRKKPPASAATEAEKQLPRRRRRRKGSTQYYEVELDRKSVHLTHEGIAAAQDAAGVGSLLRRQQHGMAASDGAGAARACGLRARQGLRRRARPADGQMEVVIVDEYTGRKMVGRQWSDGLHQAVEAKERVHDQAGDADAGDDHAAEFFKLYKALAGMTGTARPRPRSSARFTGWKWSRSRPIARSSARTTKIASTARKREKWECDHRGDQGDSATPAGRCWSARPASRRARGSRRCSSASTASSMKCSTPSSTSARRRSSPWPGSSIRMRTAKWSAT